MIEEVMQQLTALRDGQQAKVSHAREALREAEADLKRIDAMLSAGGFKRATAARPKEKASRGVSAEVIEAVREAIQTSGGSWQALSDVPGSFTVSMVEDSLGGMRGKEAVRAALEVLRGEGVIRLGGMHPLNGTRPSKVYVAERADA